MPKSNPTYFARSPRSIFIATRSILGFPPIDGLGLAIPACEITAGTCRMLWIRLRSANRSCFNKHVHHLANIERQRGGGEAVDHLKDPPVRAFCRIASKDCFGDYVWICVH